jgi:hypothetical protein
MLSLHPFSTARHKLLGAQLDYLERQVARQMAGKEPRSQNTAVISPEALETPPRLRSRVLTMLTVPFIWSCLVPLVLLDVVGTLYQAVCFPVYGIPKVCRREFLAFDRHLLGYLYATEKINCEYCAYANGILAYFNEITARTEEYWCPIKHEHAVAAAHRRDGNFLKYGDAVQYHRRLAEIRRALRPTTAAVVSKEESPFIPSFHHDQSQPENSIS